VDQLIVSAPQRTHLDTELAPIAAVRLARGDVPLALDGGSQGAAVQDSDGGAQGAMYITQLREACSHSHLQFSGSSFTREM